MMKIVSWHPVLTEHQSHTLRALASAAGAKVTVIVAREEDPTRKAQGWTKPDFGALEICNVGERPSLPVIRRVLNDYGDCVHMFGSPFENLRFILAMVWAVSKRLSVYLISESYSTVAAGYLEDRPEALVRVKAWLRPSIYRLYGLLLRRRVAGVFAISRLACVQYQAIGIPRERIFPFGYFVPALASPAKHPTTTAPACRVVFVGNLIRTKGVAELVAAAKILQGEGLGLQIDAYGVGDPESLGIDGKVVRYGGRIPFGLAQAVIADYDFLVLPSRYDGWGVVVNESILAGVPVLCSDRVGAAAFVRQWNCGMTYPAESVWALADGLRRMATDQSLRERLRMACIESRSRLAPEVAGRYVADVIAAAAQGYGAPKNPWYDSP